MTKQAIASINETTDRILEAVKGLSEDLLYWKPADDVWSIMEVLCHVEEAVPYWLNEIEKMVESPGIEWGRGLQDEARLAAVSGAHQRSLQAVLEHIERSKKTAEDVLGKLTDAELAIESPSRNPRFGTKPVQFIIDHLLVEHLDKHLQQIGRNKTQYGARA
ncbi:DinB family protein [Paenibacillus hamazuiensis]|uniref:DinB family protein n=1 Tax=Paenibacillus hamazuiensis TaxID=2936508 RepID=UPI002010735E|nr:DinB family protein [Paenibacillus hamazuiensis]